ncbi:hypothetical protein J8L88_07170 [Aquimarina sp. MMG015]|uniref:hypothetical protein n=1 Tax=Aquimarina sp. MMG015 TaxID=2822689 RepID=UPI001B3A5142|nr:hypothetical protein [Aquimarina sp. MMG015]MBQ4802635.1 hypothetical protein [Aquimarina sp. MMG015]
MKNILVLLLIGVTILSCSNDDDVANPTNCDFTTLVDASEYEDAPSDQVTINSVAIADNCLKVNFGASGCDGNTWELKLIDSESVFESNPPQRNLRLSLKNEEACQAFITQELDFDISNLQVEGNQVLLNITNSDQTVLYEY